MKAHLQLTDDFSILIKNIRSKKSGPKLNADQFIGGKIVKYFPIKCRFDRIWQKASNRLRANELKIFFLIFYIKCFWFVSEFQKVII